MSALAKIKKSAAQHEQDREYDKALAQYARLLDDGAGADEDVDVALYNRAGDLALRAGDVARAVTYFERAIDVYAGGGFLNNAIALAVKVLRHAPGHLAAHHTLGLLYGRKGFRAEARQHLAAYAAQMHRAGRGDEVRRTFGELAALGVAPADLAAVRELLTARAAGPTEAEALVRLFESTAIADASLGYEEVRARSGTGDGAATFSESLELEVRRAESTRIVADTPPAPRWATALPGEPAPLLLSRLRAVVADRNVELLDLGAVTFDAQPLAATPAPADAMVLDTFDIDRDLGDDLAGGAFSPVGLVTLDVVEPFDLADLPDGLALVPAPAPSGDAERDVVDGQATVAASAPATLDFLIAPEHVGADGSDVFATFDLDETLVAPKDEAGADPHLPVTVEPGIDIAASAHDADVQTIADRWTDAAWTGPALSLVEGVAIVPSAAAPSPDTRPDDAPLDLGAWLRSTEVPASTRLVAAAAPETGDENADFDAALHAFTAGIAQSVDVGDRESHYDLGIAFREMGLLSDAVRELQRALAAPGGGLREREALAQTFLELERPELALATLEHAAAVAVQSADALIGVHYVLAESARAVGRVADARRWYVAVLASDYDFRDAAARLAALPPPGPATA